MTALLDRANYVPVTMRVASNRQRDFERVDFQCFVFVRSGTCTDTIDFETHEGTAGSCLLIGPGQVHRFGPASDWDGWMLIVGPHHIPNAIECLPPHIRTSRGVASAIVELFERMTADASSATDPAQLDELLAIQAHLLVRRLLLGRAGRDAARLIDPVMISRYRENRAAVDQHFRRGSPEAPGPHRRRW